MSKDNIQSRPAKSLGLGKTLLALSRTYYLNIASIKQKFRAGVKNINLPNKTNGKKQRKPTLKEVQPKKESINKKSNKKKTNRRKPGNGKKKNKQKPMTKNKRTFNVPKRRSKARIGKRRRFNPVRKAATLSKVSYLNVKNFFKPVYVCFFYTGLNQKFGNPRYPFDENRRIAWTNKQRERQYGPTRFKFFQKLPREIRCIIWRASFTNRIVTVEVQMKIDTEIRKMTLVGALMTVPLALSVCRESRAEALLWYSNLVPESMRPIYFHPTLDSFAIRPMRIARNADPKRRWTEDRYFVKDIMHFIGHLGLVYNQIPKLVRCITILGAFWNNERYWDTRMQLAWNEGWDYKGLKEIVVLDYCNNTGKHLKHEKFLKSYFRIIKRTHSDCVVPRVRIIPDPRSSLPLSSDEFLSIMGHGKYEDTQAAGFRSCNGCWVKWFESEF